MNCESCMTCKYSKEWYKSTKLSFGGVGYCSKIEMTVFGDQLCRFYQEESKE